MKRRLPTLVGAAALAAMLLAGLALQRWLTGAQGAVLLGNLAARWVPELSLAAPTGSITAGQAERIIWQSGGVRVALQGIAWQLAPACPGLFTVCFERIVIDSLSIEVDPADDETSAFPLTPVELPFGLRVQQGTVGTLAIGDGAEEYVRFHELALRATMRGSDITVERLQARLDRLRGELSGEVALRDHLPITARGRLAWDGKMTADASVRGDLRRLEGQARGDAKLPVDAQGWIDPLGAGTPLELTLRGREALALWPARPEALRLTGAELHLKGTLNRVEAELQGALLSNVLGENHIAALLEGSPDELLLREATLEGAAGHASAHGRLALDSGYAWRIDSNFTGFHAPGVSGQFDALLDGRATLDGALADGATTVSAEVDLRGTINALPAALRGRVDSDTEGNLHVQGLQLESGPNRLQLDGRVGESLELDGSLTLGDLSATLSGATGRGSGRLALRGPRANPTVQAALDVDGPGWAGRHADTLHVLLDGSAGSHRVQGRLQADALAIGLDCDGALRTDEAWEGRCTRLEATHGQGAAGWQLERPVTLRRDAEPARLGIDPFCLHAAQARLCSSQRIVLDATGWRGIALRGHSLQLAALSPWLPAEAAPEGLFDLSIDASKKGAAPLELDVRAESASAAVSLAVAGKAIPMHFTDAHASLVASGKAARLGGQARLGRAGELNFALDLGSGSDSAGIDGSIDLGGIDLGPLLRSLPGTLDARGTLGGHIDIGGTLQAPGMAGHLAIVQGAFVHERLPEPIDEMVLMLEFEGPQARIGGRFVTAAGAADLNGGVHWSSHEWDAQLHLGATRLRIEPVRGSTLTLAPSLDITLSPQLATVRGVVEVPAAAIDLASVPQTAARVSEDTIVEGEIAHGPRLDYAVDVLVRLGEEVRFRGLGAEARLGGEVRLTSSSESPLGGQGEFRILEGRYAAYGQRLEVSEGRLLFRGPLDRPQLRLDAIRRIEDEPVTVGVRVRGDARAPELSVFSRPAMPESRALHYLLTGRAPQAGEDSGLAAAGALMSLGAAGATRVTGGVLGKLGIKDFAIDTGSVQGGTEVNLSGQLTPRLYLRYGVSTFDEVNTLRLRYRLTPKVFVEAISGIENAVDFLYSFER